MSDDITSGDEGDSLDDSELNLAAHPHDAFFKEIFSSPENAAAFFQEHLRPEVVGACLWPTLTLIPGSFVKRTLQQAHSDLVFSVQLKTQDRDDRNERELLLYLLFEHQTSVDSAMPLRILAYMVEMLLAHHDSHGLPLRPVIGFVLHQGPDRWSVSQHIEYLFDIPTNQETRAALMPFLPKFQHGLLDLSTFDPAHEEHHARLRMVLNLMKLARTKQLLPFFQWLVDSFDPWPNEVPDRLLERFLIYALHADSDLDIEGIARNVQNNQKLENLTMSTAAQLIEKGKAEGKAEGEAKGLWIGQIQLLERLMARSLTPREELSGLSVDVLEARFEVLQRDYDAAVKGKSGGE